MKVWNHSTHQNMAPTSTNTDSFRLHVPSSTMGGNVSPLDSRLFRTMFGNEEMRALFCDSAFVASLVEWEVTLARVQGKLGIIPDWAAQGIAQHADANKLDMDALREKHDIVGYPIVGLVEQLAQLCGESGRYLHWGTTTQDVMEGATVLQMKRGLDLLDRQLDEVRGHLVKLARDHRDTIMIGRTHLQQALPVTFGYKCAVYLSALDRHKQRLAQVRPRVLMAQFGGGAGSAASLGGRGADGSLPMGLQVLRGLAQDMGLEEPPICWHVARDGIAEVVSLLANIGGSLGKMALDFSIMCSDEFAELREPFVPHRGASSTMPHKRNPIACEVILALSKLLRNHASLATDALLSDFERATGPWHLEWVAVPESFNYLSQSLAQASFLLQGLEVDSIAMERNLDLSQGLIMAEHVMTAIAPVTGHVPAHDIIYDAARRSRETRTSLYNILAQDAKVTKILNDKQLHYYTDPRNYLGACQDMVDRVVQGR